jgi:hypothetical protein
MKPSIYPAEVWGTCSAWWHGESLPARDHLTLGLLPSCAWQVVLDEGFVRYSGEEMNLHLSSGWLPLSTAETCFAWDRPRDQANRGINNIELVTRNACDVISCSALQRWRMESSESGTYCRYKLTVFVNTRRAPKSISYSPSTSRCDFIVQFLVLRCCT